MGCRGVEDRALPDLLGEPTSTAAATQPSLDTFTADCDVLDQAVEAVAADAKSPAATEAAKEPGQAPSKGTGSFKDGKNGHSRHQEGMEAEALKGDAESAGEDKTADSKQDVGALQKVAGVDGNQDSAAAKDAGALGERMPEEAISASKPQDHEGAAAEEGPGADLTQTHGSESREIQPQAAPQAAAAAVQKNSVSTPEGTTDQQDEPAKQQTPESGVAGISARSTESGSGPHSKASKGGEPGRREAPLSDEQKAIMERGDSMLAEAAEADPKGIQLIRKLQVGLPHQATALICASRRMGQGITHLSCHLLLRIWKTASLRACQRRVNG